MTQTQPQIDGLDKGVAALFDAARQSGQSTLDAWSHACETYARYVAAIGKAQGPIDIIEATADLFASSIDSLAKSAAKAQPTNAVERR